MPNRMRLQRALARAGVASRRAAEKLIEQGYVRVNGKPAELGQSVDVDVDKITVHGQTVSVANEEAHWIALNKPSAVMTTRSKERGRANVFDFVADKPGLTYVGRLDYMTEGLILLTTDGYAVNKLTHPSTEIDRTYVVTVTGNGEEAARRARGGVQLADGMVYPQYVSVVNVGKRKWDLRMTITEGRNQEVRRICKALGLEVERLVRVQFGPVELGDLPSGKTRPLTPKELKIIAGITKREPWGQS